MRAPTITSIRVIGKVDGGKLTRNRASDGHLWHYGCIRTPQGFVAVYADERSAILQIIIDSQEYESRIERGNYTTRALVTLARRFAQEAS